MSKQHYNIAFSLLLDKSRVDTTICERSKFLNSQLNVISLAKTSFNNYVLLDISLDYIEEEYTKFLSC